MQFSILWLVAVVMILAWNEHQHKDNEKKKQLKRAAADVDEKEAILRRFEELPSWVQEEIEFLKVLAKFSIFLGDVSRR